MSGLLTKNSSFGKSFKPRQMKPEKSRRLYGFKTEDDAEIKKKYETAKVCYSFQMSLTVLLINIALNKTEPNQNTSRFLFLEFEFFISELAIAIL